jgi:hypothetical protein
VQPDCSWQLPLWGDLTPPTLLWCHDDFGAAAKNGGDHGAQGNGEEGLADEFHKVSFELPAKAI